MYKSLKAEGVSNTMSIFFDDLDCQVYDQVATAFKGEKEVVIAKVDADSHKGLGEK